VEMASINTKDGIQKRQWVKIKLPLSVSYVYQAEYKIYDVMRLYIVLGTRWMHDINRQYQIDQNRNEM
jgi:hypothetical protein